MKQKKQTRLQAERARLQAKQARLHAEKNHPDKTFRAIRRELMRNYSRAECHVAGHEAGHAYLDCFFAREIEIVTIIGEDGFEGRTKAAGSLDSAGWAEIYQEMISTCAGLLGETLLTNMTAADKPGSDDDMWRSHLLSARMYFRTDGDSAYQNQTGEIYWSAVRAARALLGNSHARLAVALIAKALLEKKTLSDAKVSHIVHWETPQHFYEDYQEPDKPFEQQRLSKQVRKGDFWGAPRPRS